MAEAIGAVGGIIGGIMGADASESAADTQARATDRASQAQLEGTRLAIDEQRRQYDTSRADLEPWRATGGAALNRLSYLLGLNVPSAAPQMLNESQIRAELLPQYTTRTTRNVGPELPEGISPELAGRLNMAGNVFGFGEFFRGLGDQQPTTTESVDYAALDAAVARRMAEQQAAYDAWQTQQQQAEAAAQNDPLYGSLLARFTMDDYLEDPGYQFRMQQGEQAINRAAAAAGRYDSGRALKDLAEFNSGLASQEFGNAYNRWNLDQTNIYNRLSGVAGTGQQTATQLANLGSNMASNIGNLNVAGGNAIAAGHINAGNAAAAGIMGQANAWSNALGGAANALGQYFTNRNMPSQTGVTLNGLRWS